MIITMFTAVECIMSLFVGIMLGCFVGVVYAAYTEGNNDDR